MQRLGPPHWPAYPPGAAYGRLYDRDPGRGPRRGPAGRAPDRRRSHGARHRCRLPAARRRAGRRRRPGDRRPRLWRRRRPRSRRSPPPSPRAWRTAACCRCSSTSPATAAPTPTATTSCRWCDADRATLEATDFAAFRPLTNLPLGMTAHVVFTAIDPVRPATTSATMIGEVIRGFIGFDGLLMSDDISMGALVGLDRRAHARVARGRLRSGAPLQRQARRDAGGRGRGARACRRGRAARRRGAGVRAVPPDAIDLPAARREFAAMMADADAPA